MCNLLRSIEVIDEKRTVYDLRSFSNSNCAVFCKYINHELLRKLLFIAFFSLRIADVILVLINQERSYICNIEF